MNQGRSRTLHNKDLEIKSATHLALVETVAGSVGHGFKIPFTGTLLSYYQLYVGLLMMIRHQAPAVYFFNTSVIVAVLKTLSPMGKKITPMIAIFMQAFLLWLGTSGLGGGVLGMMLGSVLFVSWSIVQIGIGYTLIYGFDFFRMVEFFQNEMREYTSLNIYWVFFGYWLLKIVVSVGLVFFLFYRRNHSNQWTLNEETLLSWRARLVTSQIQSQGQSIASRAFKDLANPFFFLSLGLMILFHFFQGTSTMQLIWFICRSLGMAFVLFYLIRSPWLKRSLFACFGKSKQYRVLYKKMYLVRRRLDGIL